MQICDRAKRIVVGGILTAILILGGCGQQPNKGGSPPGGAPEVAVVTIETKRLVITTELAGRTSANRVAELRPQVSGIIRKRLFEEGSSVKDGQTLFQIDPAPYQAALDNAKAALGRAEASLPAIRLKADRLRELLADKAVSQQDYDDVSAALKQTEADVQYWKAMVEAARINLGYTSITAPISGRIGRSSVTEGALVTGHQPTALATIQQLDPMYVDVPQSTTELLRLRRRLEEGRSVSCWKTTQNIPRKGRCNSATSRSIRRPDRSFCGLSFPIQRAICCRACSSGRCWKKASIPRPSWFPNRPFHAIRRGIPLR
jgi:membrane fusion protein (multidrug efflux system)